MNYLVDKVLIALVNHMDFGGCQKIVYDIVLGTHKNFRQVYLIGDRGHYSDLLMKKTDIIFIDRTSLSTVAVYKRIRDIQKENHSVILHTHHRFDIIFKYALLKANRHIHTFHSAYVNKNFLYKCITPQYAVSISKTVQNYLENYSIGSEIIYNGVDDHEKVKSKQEKKHSELRLKYVGRVTRAKGFEDLLDAFIGLKQKFKKFENLKMDVIGDGNSIEEYKKSLEKTKFKNHVNFLGFVKNPWEQITENDLVVIPSYFEGFCLVAAEAASLGIPVIGNDILALREVLDFIPESNFFDIHDKNSFYETLKTFVNNHKTQQKIALEEKERTKNRFSKPQMISHYLDVYKRVLF